MFRITTIALFCLSFSSFVLADEGEHEHRGHHGHYNYESDEGGYYQRAPQYTPPPRYNNYDQRTHQGLAGGVIGSVVGYEMGNGNPVVAGLGAAAGSFLGNGRW